MLPPQAPASDGRLGRGFELGLIAVNSDFLQPDDGAQVTPGPLVVTGYAFARADRTIVRVDVSVDGGRSWWQADLGEQLSPWSWRHWSTTVDIPEGSVQVVARAWDSSAAVQPESAAEAWNPKGYANNSWARITLHAEPSDELRGGLDRACHQGAQLGEPAESAESRHEMGRTSGRKLRADGSV